MPSVELDIEKLVHGGDGLARLPGDDGRREAVFVPFTLPGERVEVELEPAKHGRRTARLLRVLQPAPERVTPRCEVFGRCGGCQLQHASPEAQLTLKRGILLETLARTGGVQWTGDVAVHAAEPWGYRNRIQLQAVPGIGVGYYQPGSHRIVPITGCPIASPELNRGLARLAAAPPERRATIELAVDNQDQGLDADEPLGFDVGSHAYRVSPGAFFQVNRFLTPALVEAVTAGVEGETAMDLFSGVGLFALPLAAHFRHVEAIEASPAAVRDLRRNARAAQDRSPAAEEARIRITAGAALDVLRRRPATPVDLLVADPPRAGLGRDLVAAILALAPRRLHLVSCDPATLGRDLRWLTADGGYRIEALHLFDLFPQTAHIETVVRLARAD